MKKYIPLFLITFFIFSLKISFAQDVNFATTLSVDYLVDEKGAIVKDNFIIENLTTNTYAASYSLKLSGIKPQDAKAYEGSKEITLNLSEKGESVDLQVIFTQPVVGKNKTRIFSIVYRDPSIAIKTGEIWEIAIPKTTGSTNVGLNQVRLITPLKFGNLAYINPQPDNTLQDSTKNTYIFKNNLNHDQPITAAFGKFQVFLFNLTYHLENKTGTNSIQKVAIPADNSYQIVNITNFNPKPDQVIKDTDDNWLAQFTLLPNQRLDVKVEGAVQLFADSRPFLKFSENYLKDNLQPSSVWQTTDPKIMELAAKLKTPKAIYDFVTKNLTYDYSRVKPNVIRLGAKYVLDNPSKAICMEYTDLFISLARAAGIPAREIEGYAYSENRDLQPLSLVADVLHAWPEYWDSSKNNWIAIDPTWGSTTGGDDFFSKLDLRHFAFVTHGTDAFSPNPPGSYKLGDNPQKDIFVNLGPLPILKPSFPQIIINKSKIINFFETQYEIKIINKGSAALYNQKVNIYFDNNLNYSFNIETLPPLGFTTYEVKLPSRFLSWKYPNSILVVANEQKNQVFTNKNSITLINLTFLMSIILVASIILLFHIRTKKNARVQNI